MFGHLLWTNNLPYGPNNPHPMQLWAETYAGRDDEPDDDDYFSENEVEERPNYDVGPSKYKIAC